MAEVQRSQTTGEQTETFLQFVLMQTQQALFALGRHPNRPAGAPPPNLQLGKVFIDHMVMLRGKMQGNLAADELRALNNAIAHLQNAYAEVMKGKEGAG
jgi:hypothetical protein